MRHANKNAATNEEPKPSLVPRLRFPEFAGAGEWASRTFGDVTTKTDKRNKGGISYPVYSISNKAGFVPQSEQFAGVDSEKRGYDLAQYKLVGRNTFAYNPARINVGSIGFSGDLENVIVSSLYVCFKSNLEADDQFLQHFFSTRMFERSVCNHAEGGIRSYLFYENFSRIEILLPTLPEQQRIASCLSSLDELITAQARKVDALKTHKKGLMQQLFPREGETLPRLRFPEFEGAWVVKSFAELFVIGSGRDYKHLQTGEVPVYGTGGYMLSVNEALYDGESVCIGRKGTIDNPMLLSGRFWTVDTLFYTHSFMECLPSFVFAIFQMVDWRSHNEGGGVPSLSKANIQRISAALPSLPEQQRIADCLCSIDELITNESNMLETYKTHKKGLMQGLFPKVGD